MIRIQYRTNMDPSDLRLAYLSGNGTWEIIPGSTVDTTNHIISGQTSHFSTYSMVSEHKLAFGTEIVGFNSVNVFSNGSESYLSHENNSYNSYTTGMKWRSEEYVNRFYWQVYGKQIRIEGRNANDYYTHATERGLVAYANDGSESPQEGDIIVSEYGEYGHVAIVREVYASKIYVTQQNWCNNEHDSTYHLLRSGNHVDPFGGKKSKYTVKGWLRSGTAPTYSISGTVSGAVLSGVTITSSAAGSPSTTTDAGGNYSFSNVANGSYTLTPSLAGYTFSPSSTVVTVSGANKTDIDFTATANIAPTYSISGTVSGAVLSGVTITLSGDASASTITDAGGNYSFSNLANGSYTSTPSLAGYTFSPAGISLTVNNADVTGQNFTATATVETWGQKADLGGMARSGVVGFSIGSKGYIGTGILELGYGYTKEFWEYDPAANTWTQKADFGGTARDGAVGFSIGSKGYIGTGMDGSSPYYKKDFWEYDPAANTWTQKADFGGTARTDAVGFSIGSKGYIGTGYNARYKIQRLLGVRPCRQCLDTEGRFRGDRAIWRRRLLHREQGLHRDGINSWFS